MTTRRLRQKAPVVFFGGEAYDLHFQRADPRSRVHFLRRKNQPGWRIWLRRVLLRLLEDKP